MFGSPGVASAIESVCTRANEAQELVNILYEQDPGNATFEQAGILNGREIIQEYLDYNEWGVALEHLLYMIHESEIDFPKNALEELHSIAKSHGLGGIYVRHLTHNGE